MKKLLIVMACAISCSTVIAQVPAQAGTDKGGVVIAPTTPPAAGTPADRSDATKPAPKPQKKKAKKSLVKLGGKTGTTK